MSDPPCEHPSAPKGMAVVRGTPPANGPSWMRVEQEQVSHTYDTPQSHAQTCHPQGSLTMGCLCSMRGTVLLPLCIPELLSWPARLKVLGFLLDPPVAPREGTPPNVWYIPYLRDRPLKSFTLSFAALPLQVTLHSQTNQNGLHTTNTQAHSSSQPLPQPPSPTLLPLTHPHTLQSHSPSAPCPARREKAQVPLTLLLPLKEELAFFHLEGLQQCTPPH